MDLFKFTVNIHNVVNEQVNKALMSFDDAYNLYQDSCTKPNEMPRDLTSLINSMKPRDDVVMKNQKERYIKGVAVCLAWVAVIVFIVWSVRRFMIYKFALSASREYKSD